LYYSTVSAGEKEGGRPHRCLLNVELWRGARAPLVAHTTQLWKSGAFIKTAHALAPGVRSRLRLSLGRIVPPIELTAEVKVAHAESRSGGKRGVEVSFGFPSDDAREALRALLARLAAPAEESPFHVLLIEDSDLLREAFTVAMDRQFADRSRRPRVSFASSAEEGERRVRFGAYDLLLVDQDLAGEPGATLVRRIRASKKHASMPIIGVTMGGREPQTELRAAGADLCLQKPLVFRDILTTLDRLLPRATGR
jgi:CheY-like chemotaxis protein